MGRKSTNAFMVFQTYGPFKINVPEHMRDLGKIIAAMTLASEAEARRLAEFVRNALRRSD